MDDRLLEVHAKSEEHQSETFQHESPPLQNNPSIQNTPMWPTENYSQPAEHLSAREIAILERIVRGDSNKLVARFFNIAEPTVKAHVKAILRKVGASNRTQAAIWALNHRLFDSPTSSPQTISIPLQPANDGSDGLQPWPAFKANGHGVLKRTVS
jgi:DNA-binding NarL/FixJ family response regulator